MDKRLFFLVNQTRNRLLDLMDNVLTHHFEVTTTQMAALLYLSHDNNCRIKELGEGLGIKRSGITGLVNRMEKAGLIVKVPCEEDARSSRVTLTDHALGLVRKAGPLILELDSRLKEGFSEHEMETVFRFLNTNLKRIEGALLSALSNAPIEQN